MTATGSSTEKKWYVVHTYSGFEQRAKQALEERIRSLGKDEFFGEILIPSESIIEVKKGEKKTARRTFFPGYILVNMVFNEETWHIVKNTSRITGFVGNSTHPPFVPEEEIRKITNRISEGVIKPKLRIEFEKGETVRVADGPFANFSGVVDEVNSEKGKLRILVSIFGRSTPIELDFAQVEKG